MLLSSDEVDMKTLSGIVLRDMCAESARMHRRMLEQEHSKRTVLLGV